MQICPACTTEYEQGIETCPLDGTRLVDRDQLKGPQPDTELGQYRLIRLIGEGSMGWVYQAEHILLGRPVALKLLRPEFAANPRAVARFFAEARAVNRINHPHIVEITDFFDEEGECKYYIMELLEGRTYGDLKALEGVLPLPRTLGIAIQVCEALAAVHAADIIHRDMKPDNIFLTEKHGAPDYVKLLDFGVAKIVDQDGISLGGTAAGTILGTPEYMSPEQVGGENIDLRSDVYSFGVILYEMVTGRRPHEARSFGELVIKHMTVAPRPPSTLPDLPEPIPAVLEELILQCLAKAADARPASMDEMAERLRDIAARIGGAPIAAVGAPARGRRKRKGRKRTTSFWAGLGAMAAALLLGAGTVIFWGTGSPGTAEPQPDKPVANTAAPTAVSISFSSTPPGASVFHTDATTMVGVTPFTRDFPVAAGVAEFLFRRDGFAEERRRVALEGDVRIEVTLRQADRGVVREPETSPAKARKRRPATRKRSRSRPKRSDTLDPFSQ